MDEHLRKTLSNVGKVELSIISRLSGARKGEDVTIQFEGLYKDNRDLIDQFIAGAGNDLELEMTIGDRVDIRFLDALESEGIIDCLYSYAESKAKVKIKSSKKLREIREWVELVKPNLIEYGSVSFDISRGDVYFFDQKARLKPDRGMYKIFKKMMIEDVHSITTDEIVKILDTTGKSDHMGNGQNRTESEIATQVIADLRNALGWKGELASFIEHRASKRYTLLPFLPGK